MSDLARRHAPLAALIRSAQELVDGAVRRAEDVHVDPTAFEQLQSALAALELPDGRSDRTRTVMLAATVAVLRANGTLQTGQIAAELGVARYTALRYLQRLSDDGVVTRHGQSAHDPHARWALADTAPGASFTDEPTQAG